MRLASVFSIPLLSLAALAVNAYPKSFQNDVLTRSVELGGTVTTVVTTITARSTAEQPGDYILPLAGKDGVQPIAWEVSLGKKKLGQLTANIDQDTG